jgi:prepilin-type N-terminal cleavage/methylation domain-containing protein
MPEKLGSDFREQRAGFVLFEVIVSLVLVGVIATFSSIFLISGIEGYLFSKKATESALKAQIAMDRIGLELRDINNIQNLVSTSITYTRDNDKPPGITRMIKFNSGNIYINFDGTDYILLDDISNFTLTAISSDLNNDGNDEIAYIDLRFTISDIPEFKVWIYPRNMVPEP